MKCKNTFEASIRQVRCTTYKCQSRQIKEIYVPLKLTFGPRDLGHQTEKQHVRQGRHIRKDQAFWLEKELQDKLDA